MRDADMAELEAAGRLLVVPAPSLTPGMPYPQAREVLQRWQQDVVLPAHRAQVREWHPDRNPHRADEALERTKQINAARDLLMSLAIPPPRPQPMWFGWGSGSATTYGGGSTAVFINGVRVA